MGTNCAPHLTDLFLYSYEVDFLQELLRNKEKELAIFVNFTFCYKDEVIPLNNSKLCDYPIELEIKNTTDTAKSASYLYKVLQQ